MRKSPATQLNDSFRRAAPNDHRPPGHQIRCRPYSRPFRSHLRNTIQFKCCLACKRVRNCIKRSENWSTCRAKIKELHYFFSLALPTRTDCQEYRSLVAKQTDETLRPRAHRLLECVSYDNNINNSKTIMLACVTATITIKR